MSQTYVFKGKEVSLTGRKAVKTNRRGKRTEMFEVKPIKFPDADGEWVRMEELFQVVGDSDE
jgi:hypothetical protein